MAKGVDRREVVNGLHIDRRYKSPQPQYYSDEQNGGELQESAISERFEHLFLDNLCGA